MAAAPESAPEPASAPAPERYVPDRDTLVRVGPTECGGRTPLAVEASGGPLVLEQFVRRA